MIPTNKSLVNLQNFTFIVESQMRVALLVYKYHEKPMHRAIFQWRNPT